MHACVHVCVNLCDSSGAYGETRLSFPKEGDFVRACRCAPLAHRKHGVIYTQVRPKHPLEYPYGTPRVPPEYPSNTPYYPVLPPWYPSKYAPSTSPSIRASPVRTSVGADPNVLEAGAGGADVAEAADDVDGAGVVDHGRVPPSRSPRRAGRTGREPKSCGHGG